MPRILVAEVVLAAVLVVGTAHAQAPQLQNAPLLGQPAPPSPARFAPPFAAPSQEPQGGAAPMPAQPAGGFAVVPPAPDRQDAARRMKLDGAADEVKRLSGDADKTLGGMMPGGSAPLPAPAISGEGDLKELQQVQRQIQLYNSKNTLAEIVVKYWGTVFNNEHAKAWREEERKQADAEAERAKKAAAEEAERAKAAAQTAATQLLASGGAGASVEAPLPRVYEILGAEAGLIVHGAGLTYAHAGQTLGNGDKVVAVSGAGVVIERDGKKLSLGFATGR